MAGETAASVVELGVSSAPMLGEEESGDRYVVQSTPDGVLLAVIDGLGHGLAAATAARTAARTLEGSAERSVTRLLHRCHLELRRTRGVVMSLVAVDARLQRVTWAGVGNVEGILLRANRDATPAARSILRQSGVLGYHLPQPTAAIVPIDHGDLIILSTDGIARGFEKDLPLGAPVQELADVICTHHRTGKDDALVLVARYTGAGQ